MVRLKIFVAMGIAKDWLRPGGAVLRWSGEGGGRLPAEPGGSQALSPGCGGGRSRETMWVSHVTRDGRTCTPRGTARVPHPKEPPSRQAGCMRRVGIPGEPLRPRTPWPRRCPRGCCTRKGPPPPKRGAEVLNARRFPSPALRKCREREPGADREEQPSSLRAGEGVLHHFSPCVTRKANHLMSSSRGEPFSLPPMQYLP